MEWKDYLAHRKVDSDGKVQDQLLRTHLEQTAERCEHFSSAFGCGELGRYAGRLHDLGKYSDAFQKRIRGDSIKTDHSTAGAKAAKMMPVQMVVAGHHSGLMDLGSRIDTPESGTLKGRMKKIIPDEKSYLDDIGELGPIPKGPALNIEEDKDRNFYYSFFTRMLYSCLVDADFLDTEAFMRDEPTLRGGFDDWSILYERLNKKTHQYLHLSSDKPINQKRNEILSHCIEFGKSHPRGLYSLTVPTGGGKTIASLAFAMEQVQNLGMDRIIYVIPYTSIIDQTVDEFQKILGSKNVLAHHSQVVYDDPAESGDESITRKKLATENWDAPIVVTTNVQFFESLFGCRSSQCRKLHNIVNSVIIFDEAQMLPYDYLLPCVKAIGELVRNYRCTSVLCTATQPSLQAFFPAGMKVQEICANYQELYTFFRRVTYDVVGELSQDALVGMLSENDQVLCIVNTKAKARTLYEALPGEGNFHLSTWMQPCHRRRVIETIKKRLKDHLPCRVVSTSLIEAGINLDFPLVFREVMGLDSIIQAGGRCNREGMRSKNTSKVHVFWFQDKKMPKGMEPYIETTQALLPDFNPIDTPECIQTYFTRVYHYKDRGLDAYDILEKSNEFALKTVSKDFKLINQDSFSVFIANDDEAVKMQNQFRFAGPSRGLLRQMGQYMVSLRKNEIKILIETHLVEMLDDSLFLLKNNGDYSEETGLRIPEYQGSDGIIM